MKKVTRRRVVAYWTSLLKAERPFQNQKFAKSLTVGQLKD